MKHSLQSLSAIVAILVAGAVLWVTVVSRRPEPPLVPPRDLGPVPVRTRLVEASTLELVLDVYGQVRPRRELELRFEAGGALGFVHPEWRPGRRIEAGEALLALEERPYRIALAAAEAALAEERAHLAQAEAELERDRAGTTRAGESLDLAQREAARVRELARSGASSTSARDTAEQARIEAELRQETARAALAAATARLAGGRARIARAESALAEARYRLERARITAPFAGTLAGLAPTRGREVAPGEVLGALVDFEVWSLAARVPEERLGELAIGQSATIRLGGRLAGQGSLAATARGVLVGIDPRSDPVSRRVVVEIEVRDGVRTEGAAPAVQALAVGSFAEAELELGRHEDALWIARREFVWRGGVPVAFVVVGTHVERRELEFGPEHGEGFVVRRGLAAGDVLALEPLERLRDATPCVVVERAERP